ncbi:MAG: cytochrome c oxidase subunit 3 [Acidobacteriota bacterium]
MTTIATHASASTVRLGMWLFLASEAMLFGSLVSGYALLRAGAPAWPSSEGVLNLWLALGQTLLLAAATLTSPRGLASTAVRGRLLAGGALALVFVCVKVVEYGAKLDANLTPAANLLLASWFTLTGVHAAHVAGGALAAAWLAGPGWNVAEGRRSARLDALGLYWLFVDAVWLVLLVGFYLV